MAAEAETDSVTEPEEEECSCVELKILQKYTWELHEANIEPMRLVLDLVPHGFVTWMAYQRIREMASCETQSFVIINGLLRAVARQREKFHRLLQILNEHPPLLSIVANKIKDEYQGIVVADQTLQVDEHVSNLKEFVFKFKKVAETTNINIDDLRQFIISYHPNNECQSKVKDANDIDDIFVVLHTTFCSFFNYSILVRIAENFKLSDGFKVILTYEFEKDNYQKKLASMSLAEELQKENECFDYSMYQCMIILGLQTSLVEHLTILEFKEFIKRALYDYGDYLHLLKIELAAGSFVESTFCAPNEVMRSLISQAEDKTAFLKDIGVNKFIVGDTVIIDNIEDAGKNARHWEVYLEEYIDATANSKTLSQNPSEATIKIYCDYLSESKTNPDAYVLVKTVILVLTNGDGFISLIPEKCFNAANVSGLFSALKCFLPHLDASLKKKVISFLINNCEPFRNVIVEGKFVTESHTSSQWLYDEGVYQLLHDMHYMNNLTLSLLNALVLDDKPEIIRFLMSKCSISPSKLQKMATYACKEKNLIIASLFLEKMKSFTVDVVKGFSKYFDVETFKEFLQTHCNPEKKGELLNFCFCSDKIEIDKRKKFAMAILESGGIDTAKINLRDVLKYPKFLLFSDLSFLEKLLNAGVSLDSNLLHEAVKLIVDGIERHKIELERVKLICILIENGADVVGLEAAYSGSGGSVVHAATELALQTKYLHILKLVCGKTDVSKCLYDDKKMTPLHVVMKKTECDEASIKICHFLCYEIKIDPCIKDCDGLSPEDYCDDKSDKRLKILRKASSLHCYPHTVGKKVKNQKMSIKKAIPESEGLDQKEALDYTDQSHDSVALSSIKKNSPSGSINTRSTYDKQSSHQADSSKPMTLHFEAMTYKKMERLLVDALHEDSSYFASKGLVNPTSHPTNESLDVDDIIDESEGDAEELKILNEEAKYEVFCSPRVKKFFETARPKLVERVLCTIKKLACGQSNARLSRKMHSKVQTMYHGDVDSAKRVLWYKTVLYCPSRHSHCNVLVILDVITDHKKLDKAVENAENWIKRGREEGGVYTVELIFKGKPSCYRPVSVPSETSKEVLFMMKDEYGAVPIYSLPEYVLKMIRNSPSVSRLGLPLKLSYQEHCIVDMDPDETAIANMSYHESTILVVGRSGTGKTTCCLSRMWEEFRHYWEILNDNNEPIIPRSNHWRQNSKMIEEPSEANDKLLASCMSRTEDEAVPGEDKCDHLHQVFVTKSPYLCQEVKHRFYDLVSSHHLLHKKHLELEHAALPTSFNDLQYFPLFITSRRLLMLMDSTLGNDSYFRWKNGKLHDIIANSEQLYNEENIGSSLDDVDEFESDSEDESENELQSGIVTDGYESGRTMIEVTASLFQNQIWDKISSHKILKKMKIDPILVWQEIKSFIKGSILSLTSVNGYLSKEEYFEIGKNKAPNFTENREVIYTLFQEYQKYCKSPMEKGQEYFDECDLLHHLYKHRSKFSCIIHNFYIDEVQDFTEAELYLLLSLSHCPNGNFLCGDSAQSIMRGVSFRFTDVRSLFYELGCLKGKVVVPEELHYLTVNYRAHAGIVNIANSVIELLGRFFKDSFDAIPKSIENITYCDVMPTRKPLLLCHDKSPEDMLANQFAVDEVREIHFGAHQAVIIPSKETVIPESLKNSLVFTVLEAKGLEFNDVLLFNFFSSSQVSKKSWELVSAYTCLEVEKSEKKIATKYIPVLKNYNESEHKALNAELKCLYTALTRAKRNLWIYDNFDNESEDQHPMYEFFVTKGLIKEFNESDIDFTTEESTAEEWKAAGDFFMSRQLWEQAQTSYLRAQDASRLYQVHAFMEAQKSKFLNAAGYFLKAATIVHDRQVLIRAAKCFKAATFKISKDEKIHCYNEIAQFLEKLGKIKQAGEFYILAEEYDHFIRVCEERKRWNRVICRLLAAKQKIRALKKAIEYRNKGTIEGFGVRNLAHECVRFVMKNESKSFVKKVIINELKDKALVAKYLAVHEFHDDVLDFYILSNEYSKALEYAWKHGLYDQGLKIAEIMDQDQEMKFVLCCAYAKLADQGDVKETVESLECARSKFCNKNFDAQVLMLKAKFCCDISACKKAICMFDELQNEGGVIEAVNILYSMLENPSATDVLKFSLRATQLSKVFQTRKISQTESKWLLLYFKLNQIQLLPDNSVLVPPCQAHWLQLQLNSTSISRQNLNQKILEHFKKCYESWLTKINVKDAFESLSFFRKSPSSEYPYNIGDIELCATFYNFFDSQIQMQILNILLTPFTLFNIFQNSTWQQHHLQSIQANTAILNMCKAEYKKVLHKQMCQNFNSLDQCMKLWRLSLITTGSTIELRDELKNTKTVDIKFCIDADSSHIFCSWIDFPFSMTEFLSSTNNELLQKLIFSPETFPSISCENLLYILIVQSISSIFFISMHEHEKTFFVPQIFSFVVNNFNILVSPEFSVIESCSKESERYRLECQDALSLLRNILILLQNNCTSRFLSHENHEVTICYFILILTLYTNILIAESKPDGFYYKNCTLLATELQPSTSEVVPSFAKKINDKMIAVSSFKDIFNVFDELLSEAQNKTMNQIWSDGKKIKYKRISCGDIIEALKYFEPICKIKQGNISSNGDHKLEDTAKHLVFKILVIRKSDHKSQAMKTFFRKLKEHTIINDFCKVCDCKINLEPRKGKYRELEQNSTSYDEHVKTFQHKLNRGQNEQFRERRESLEAKVKLALKIIKKLRHSPYLVPDDDITSIKSDDQLSSIFHQADKFDHIYSRPKTTYLDLIEMESDYKIRSHHHTSEYYKLFEELEKIQQGLQRISESIQNAPQLQKRESDSSRLQEPIEANAVVLDLLGKK